ncbi:MAG: Hsp20/alpha crystallin family protein [Thermomicrobiales bacterium]
MSTTTTTTTPPFAGPAASSGESLDLMSLSEALAAIPDDAFARTPVQGVPESGASRLLALDVLETPDHFEIHASVPGIDPASLDITVLGESVRIAGEGHTAESPAVTEESDYRWLVRERPVGRFDRTVSLPSPVDRGAVDATVRDGVLIVTLPKAQRSAQVRIPVRFGESPTSQGSGEEAPVIDLSPHG